MEKIKKIIVAVDGSVDGCKAVDRAIDLAGKNGAQLDFVYVSSHINKDIPSDLIFDKIWDKLPKTMKAEKHVENGSVHKAIIEVAKKENADLIIMGSRGLGLFKGALIGSKSQKVVEYSTVPVMVVK
ncbi:universal stress protein [Pectinatus frisingensis]|uniref:universal stress protein n=1 Tax=Pectinatus frisingensis TaxID=865 RepID=UPI0018C5E667|nr:universal stress protein [Pectinatus frisingensis]